MRILLYIAVGLGIGSVSGTLGIGGGVLLMPALIWLFGFDHPKAAGTTLAILAFPVGLWPTVWVYFRDGHIDGHDLKAALWIAGAFAVGAYTGATFVKQLSAVVNLQMIFGLLLIYIGTRFVMGSHSEATDALAGLVAVTLAWGVYLYLRILGSRHLPKPDLGQAIQQAHERNQQDEDYTI